MIKAVLFDFDGTLINTNDLIFDSYRTAFRRVLGRHIDDAEILSLYGRPLYASLMEYGEVGEALYYAYREFNESRHDRLAKAFEGAVEGVNSIREKGYITGIVSSKRLELVERGLKLMNLTDAFDIIITPADTEKAKPDPEPILCACRRLEINPCEAIYVGDSEFDLAAGNAAGTKIAAVKYSMAPHERLLEFKPDYFIDSIEELAGILEEDI